MLANNIFGVDGLIGQFVIGGKLATLHMEPITDIVDLFVDLGTMVVSVLTSTGNSALDTARMPDFDTGDLAKTCVVMHKTPVFNWLGAKVMSGSFE